MPLTAAEVTALDRWRPQPPLALDLLATRSLNPTELMIGLLLARQFTADPSVVLQRMATAKDAVQEFLLSRQQTPVDMSTR